jgi:hypothetical protein
MVIRKVVLLFIRNANILPGVPNPPNPVAGLFVLLEPKLKANNLSIRKLESI